MHLLEINKFKKKIEIKRIIFFIVLSCLFLFSSPMSTAQIDLIKINDNKILRAGCSNVYPYQYTKDIYGNTNIVGLDISLIKAIGKKAGYEVKFIQMPWHKQIEMLKKGNIDIVLRASKTTEREHVFRFSDPVRNETNALYTHHKYFDIFKFNSIEKLLNFIKKEKVKIGVTKGYIYTNDKINDFIANQTNSSYLVTAKNGITNFMNLQNKKVDIVLTNDLIAASLIHKNGWENDLVQCDLPLFKLRKVYYIFNKQNTTVDEVNKINTALQVIKKDGTYSQIVKSYLFPVMLSLTINMWWYFYIILIGVAAYSIYALKFVIDEGYSFIGALIFVSVFALGGGALRDIMMNRFPIFFVGDPYFLYLTFITTAVGFLITIFYRKLFNTKKNNRIISILRIGCKTLTDIFFKFIFILIDALGLAVFTVFGVLVALEVQAKPLIFWGPILAVITIAGGGVICDTLRSAKISSMRNNFYLEISAIWGFILSYALDYMSDKADGSYIDIAVFLTVVGAFIMRILVYYLNIPTLSFMISKCDYFGLKKSKK